MDRTWQPTTAGTLNIISGCFGIAGGIYIASLDGLELDFHPLIIAIIGVLGVSRIALGVISLIGGILARKRRFWEMALAGSITAIFCAPPLGILSTIFISLGKKEFE